MEGLLWKNDQPVAEALTCTGQDNIQTQETNTHDLSGIETRIPSNQATKTHALHHADTGIGLEIFYSLQT